MSTSLEQQKEEKALARFSCEWMALISMEFSCMGQREFDALGSESCSVKLGGFIEHGEPGALLLSGGGVKAIVEIYYVTPTKSI